MLKVKVAQNDPLDSFSQKIDQVAGGQQDQGHGVVLHAREEVYQSTLALRRRVAKSYTSQFCPNLNLIKDKTPVLGLDIVERQV